jgi:RES domain-containing protein
MELWRISNYADLSGRGGLLAAGRWHTRGKRIVYLADHPASALLEMLVHMDRDLLPSTFQLLHVTVSAAVDIQRVEVGELSPDWRTRPDLTRQIGDQWLDQSPTVLLQVPSVIVPLGWNFLLNPVHSDAAKIAIADIVDAPFDARLLG